MEKDPKKNNHKKKKRREKKKRKELKKALILILGGELKHGTEILLQVDTIIQEIHVCVCVCLSNSNARNVFQTHLECCFPE